MTTNTLATLLERITDPGLRAAISSEVERLRSTKDYGLVFERHLPEEVRLLSHPIKRGVKVQERRTESEQTWVVASMKGDRATLVDESGVVTTRATEDLVVIRGFGEAIYPGLKGVGRIERGGDKPFHSVVNGENFYVLETLLYAYEGHVDCIYIDPPYNSGARDWKYNNDYVDGEDVYRHSKWLSFMEKRLKIAKRLLNSEESVLIVTIDEREYLRLGLLLEQIFPEATRQMVTTCIKPSGSTRANEFSRVEEYLFFVMIGNGPGDHVTDMLRKAEPDEAMPITWQGLRRRGSTDWRRSHRPNGFYPIYIKDGSIHSVGEPIPLEAERSTVVPPKRCWAAWPLDPSGAEGRWQITPERLREQLKAGTAGLASADESAGSCSIIYLKSGDLKKISRQEVNVVGRGDDGRIIVENTAAMKRPKTMWVMESHDASAHGTALLSKFIGDRRFPFPKSLYAVEDALRFFVADKPDALILDFFGGSGTTTHAVARLNRQDGGHRRSIVVTNNEVSDEEARSLRKSGHFPGQSEWEALGIFEYITRPRVVAAITGKTPDGQDVAGDYKFVDVFPMAEGFEENVEFFELTYLDRNSVARGKAFEAIAPLLWMRFGASGELIAKVKNPYAMPKGAHYAVLFDISHWQAFAEALRDREDVRFACIVTDSIAQYQQVVAELPPTVEPTMLYEDYLRNFEINTEATA